MTPETRIMVPWHPVPGDTPPKGCEWVWTRNPEISDLWEDSPEGWDLWEDGSEAPNWNPVIQAAHLDTSVGSFKFRIPLPPAYAVVIIDDTTLREAPAICDVLSIGAMYDTVADAYADYVANRVGDYEDQHHAV